MEQPMKRILVIDPSSKVQTEIRSTLSGGYEMSFAANLTEARLLLARDLFDLILTESQLSDGNASSFCAQLKANDLTSDVPVIFLSEQNILEEKVQAFQQGADDFVLKPFEPLELRARIEVRVKRAKSQIDREALIQKGDLVLSVPYQKAVLREGGEEKDLRLTPTEFRLLYFFIKNEGEVLSRNQLLTTIWSDDVHVLTRTIDKHISTLKKKLGLKAKYIQSIHSRGYRFAAVGSDYPAQQVVLEPSVSAVS
jgi:two-component system phosphate regulon response regulator PhoB